ncbi:hypothetical protein OUZ56_003421 [Daphnia magna]|uniref:Uncharacterized protein n=1 Tax=Daphnia magna TaxID=35525 RepID=A0ABR0A8P1_9CRUS|nr:hypothetical protein OUZ56_003421 [Daphnia magna]
MDVRFETGFQDDELVIATCVHPKFKLDWIQDETDVRSYSKMAVIQEMENNEVSATCDRDPLDFPSKNTATLDELELFFIDKDKCLAMLDKYPRVKNSLGVLLVGRLHDTQQYTTALNSTNNTTATQNHYTGLPLWPAIDGLLRPLTSGQSGRVR